MKRLLLSSVLSIFCLTLSAQTNTWNGSNGFWDTPGSWSLNIVPNQEHDVVIPAGSTVLLNVDAFTKSITLQGNAIFNIINTSSLDLSFTNASTFSAASSFNWSGGTIKGGGTLTLNGTTVITPENTYYFKRIEDNTTIINNGTLLQQGSADILIHHGTLINNPSGVIEMQVAGANIVKASNAIEATVINEGLIKRTGTGRVDIKTNFQNNGGTISVEGGTLRFEYSSNHFTNGIYNVATGSLMEWRGDFLLAGTLTGVLNGDIQCGDGALCKFNIPVGTTANFNFSGNANMFWKAGAQIGGGTLVNSGKIYIKPNNNWKIQENSTLSNLGVINIGGSTGSDLRIEDGTLINQAAGIIDLQADSANILASGTGLHNLNNFGLIKRTSTTGTATIEAATTNSGIIDVQMGELEFKGNLGFNNTMDGKVMGVATLDLPPAAAFTNDGIFSPGGYPGTLTVQGDFKSSSTSELQIEIYGPTQGTEYDLLAVQGNAIMDGDVTVALYYAPIVGDEFVVLTATNITSCNLPATITAHHDGHNYTFDVICSPTNVTLKITNIVLAIEENKLSNLAIYPNPSKGQFTIEFGGEYTDVTIQIYNMLGQLISADKYASAKAIAQEINASAGTYFVKVSTAKEGSKTLRIIKN